MASELDGRFAPAPDPDRAAELIGELSELRRTVARQRAAASAEASTRVLRELLPCLETLFAAAGLVTGPCPSPVEHGIVLAAGDGCPGRPGVPRWGLRAPIGHVSLGSRSPVAAPR